MNLAKLQRWWMVRRLERCERLLARQRAGALNLTTLDQRFIEKLYPDELIDAREAQSFRRWRTDAIYVLNLEVQRLRELLGISEAAGFASLPPSNPIGEDLTNE